MQQIKTNKAKKIDIINIDITRKRGKEKKDQRREGCSISRQPKA
jgi:hypothetical protein